MAVFSNNKRTVEISQSSPDRNSVSKHQNADDIVPDYLSGVHFPVNNVGLRCLRPRICYVLNSKRSSISLTYVAICFFLQNFKLVIAIILRLLNGMRIVDTLTWHRYLIIDLFINCKTSNR